MGDIEHDWYTVTMQNLKTSHIDNEVVVTEAVSALGHADILVASTPCLVDSVPNISRSDELTFLDVDRSTGRGCRHDQICLPTKESRDLQDIADLGRGGTLFWFVNVREQRQTQPISNLGENGEGRFEANRPKAAETATICLVERSLENEVESQTCCTPSQMLCDGEGELLAFDDTGAGDDRELPTSELDSWSDFDRLCGQSRSPSDTAGIGSLARPRVRSGSALRRRRSASAAAMYETNNG